MKKLLKPLLIIGGVFLFSLIIKLKDVSNFGKYGNVFSCYDCYWYGRIAKELRENVFTSIDYLRNVPDYVFYAKIPLLSYLAYIISKLFNIDLNTLFIYMPPILAVLFIIPLYKWIKHFAPIHVFLAGALIGIFNTIYFNRTMPGRFDTDMLVLFFVFSILFFITRAVYEKDKFFPYIFLTSITFYIFMWWYEKPIFALFFLISFILGLLYQKTEKKEFVLKTLVFIFVLNPVYLLAGIYQQFGHYVENYILKDTSHQIIPFNLFGAISELKSIGLNEFIAYTTDNPLTAIIAVVGVILLYVYRLKYMLIATPFILVGLMSFVAGNRFMMYLSPFIGMGLGYSIYMAFKFLSKRYLFFKKTYFSFFSIILVLFLSFPPQRLYFHASPIITDKLWLSLKEVKNEIKEDSYLWSWWDYGCILQYVLENGTYTDNGSFNFFKSYLFAHSMMVYDENKSYNIISFATNEKYAKYGKNLKGLKDTLELMKQVYNYNKPPTKPVYVFLFPGLMVKNIIHNLGVFGMNIYDDKTPSVSTFQKCIKENNIFDCGIITLNTKTNSIKWKNPKLENNPPYKEVIFVNRDNETIKTIYKNPKFPLDRLLEVIYSKNGVYFIIANYKIKQSILNRMFILKEKFKHFKLIYDNFPYLVVYRVI